MKWLVTSAEIDVMNSSIVNVELLVSFRHGEFCNTNGGALNDKCRDPGLMELYYRGTVEVVRLVCIGFLTLGRT